MRKLRRFGRKVIGIGIGACLASAMACATAPASDPAAATLWGEVRLVPKQNAPTPTAGGGYGDRRLADVKRFDYSQLRFAVVFAPEAKPRDRAPLAMTIRDSARGARLEPSFGATTARRGITIRNETNREQVVSAPGASWLRRIAAGASVRMEGPPEGELTLHLLGGSGPGQPESALVWIATGVVAEVDADGRYVIGGLEPGHQVLRAWHPRLPPTPPFEVDVARGEVLRVDLEIGVDAGLHHTEWLETGNER